METTRYVPRLIVLELTQRCILNCLHCRASIDSNVDNEELTTQEWLGVLDDIAANFHPIIILSGGEALLRKDIFELISYGCKKQLDLVLATCGVSLTQKRAKRLKQLGIKRVSISVDGKDASTHDMIRGETGIFDKALSAMMILKDERIEFQVNTTVTRYNVSQLEDIFRLAENSGAVSFHPFFLVPVGRASRQKNMQISAFQYEGALNWLYEKSKVSSLSCRPTCAPQYFRILVNAEKTYFTQMGTDEKLQISTDALLDAKTQGCLAGKSFCFISCEGKVYPCGFLEKECGSIRDASFTEVWQESSVFGNLRDLSKYKGKCGKCEYLGVCGGCRARAYEATGDYLEEEPECLYQPLSVKS